MLADITASSAEDRSVLIWHPPASCLKRFTSFSKCFVGKFAAPAEVDKSIQDIRIIFQVCWTCRKIEIAWYQGSVSLTIVVGQHLGELLVECRGIQGRGPEDLHELLHIALILLDEGQ